MTLLRSIFNDAIANHVFKHNPVSGPVGPFLASADSNLILKGRSL
jgi:hypothetical protein